MYFSAPSLPSWELVFSPCWHAQQPAVLSFPGLAGQSPASSWSPSPCLVPSGVPPCCHQVVLAAPSPLPPVHSDLLHLSPCPREKAEATRQVPSSTCHSSPSSGQLQAATPTPSVETLSLLATQGPRSLCRGTFYIICMSLWTLLGLKQERRFSRFEPVWSHFYARTMFFSLQK